MDEEKKRTRKGVSMGRVTVCRLLEDGEGAGAWLPLEVPCKTAADAAKWLKESSDAGKFAVVRLIGIRTVTLETTTVRRVS